MSAPRIAIVYLLFYHNASCVDDMVSALKRITYPKDRLELVIVSNLHPKDGSFIPYIEKAVMPLSGHAIPHVTLLHQDKNLGFSGGNNVGARWAVEHGYDFVYFHNNDGFLAADALEQLVAACTKDEKIAIIQSCMLLYPETDRVNSAGNSFHYLGFGFCDRYRLPIASLSLPKVKEIDYASGAAMMVRTDIIAQHGGWDEDFFLYHEDLEWALRLRSKGYRIVLARDSIFYHQYQFGRSVDKIFWMERNRFAVMLLYFRVPTLLLLAPMALALEVGLWALSVKNGYAGKRWAVYRYWLQPKHWRLWLAKRRKIQSERTVSDRDLFRHSVSGIFFQDKMAESFLLRYIGNPLMTAYYWTVVRGLIWW